MPPEAPAGSGPDGSRLAGLLAKWRGLPLPWRAGLIRLALVWGALFALFWPEWQGMAYQWWHGPSYSHVLVIPPILLWLVAMRADALLALPERCCPNCCPNCWWPGLACLAAAVLLWAAGAFLGLAVVSEAGAVAMLAASVPLLLGVRVAAGLLFPLGYMAFLVPAGDELIPPLQALTAWMTVGLLHASGVRAAIDGVFISTPIGLFQVADACSGVRFLIAMVAFGVLAANLCFVTWGRRLVFLGVCLVVPVLANGVRAWGTVALAQVWGLAWARGFDHIVYGWVFFGLVIAGMMLGFRPWFDRAADAPMVDGAALAASARLGRWEKLAMAPARALLAGAVLVGGPMLWVGAANNLHAPLPASIALPDVPGWRKLGDAPRPDWHPLAHGAARRVFGSYTNAAGARVDVFIALYDGQGPGRKATTVGEGAIPALSGWVWQGPPSGGFPVVADAATERMMNKQGVSRLAETSYRTGSLLTGSRLALVLASGRDRLALRPRPVAMVILSAQEGSGASAAAGLAAFRRATGPLGGWVDGICNGGAHRPAAGG